MSALKHHQIVPLKSANLTPGWTDVGLGTRTMGTIMVDYNMRHLYSFTFLHGRYKKGKGPIMTLIGGH